MGARQVRGPPLPAEAGAGVACCHSPLPLFRLGAVLILQRHRKPLSCLARHPDAGGCQRRSPCREASPGRDKPGGSASSPRWAPTSAEGDPGTWRGVWLPGRRWAGVMLLQGEMLRAKEGGAGWDHPLPNALHAQPRGHIDL